LEQEKEKRDQLVEKKPSAFLNKKVTQKRVQMGSSATTYKKLI
jgi:hypothetical protein